MSLEDKKIDTQAKRESKLTLGHRPFLGRTLICLALSGLAGTPTPARAQEGSTVSQDDPYYRRDFLDVHRPSVELNDEEIERMQKCQKVIYRSFLNPGFGMYLDKTRKADKAYAALRLAIEFPDEFEYKEESPGIYELTKRVNGNKKIPGDFYLRIEMKQLAMIDRKTKVNANGWKSWSDYEKVINKTTGSINQNLNDLHAVPSDISEREWRLFEAYTLKMPWRLKELIELRNKGGEFDGHDDTATNKTLAKFFALIEGNAVGTDGKKHSKTLEEMRKGGYVNFYVTTSTDFPDAFEIGDTSVAAHAIIGLSHEGFLQVRHGDYGWKTPKSYQNAIAKRYCDKIGKKCKSILK